MIHQERLGSGTTNTRNSGIGRIPTKHSEIIEYGKKKFDEKLCPMIPGTRSATKPVRPGISSI